MNASPYNYNIQNGIFSKKKDSLIDSNIPPPPSILANMKPAHSVYLNGKNSTNTKKSRKNDKKKKKGSSSLSTIKKGESIKFNIHSKRDPRDDGMMSYISEVSSENTETNNCTMDLGKSLNNGGARIIIENGKITIMGGKNGLTESKQFLLQNLDGEGQRIRSTISTDTDLKSSTGSRKKKEHDCCCPCEIF